VSKGKFPGIVGMVALMAALRAEPATAIELRQRLGLSNTGVYAFLSAMRAFGRTHVVGWVQRPRVRALPRYAFGPGVDVPPPTKTTNGRPVTRGGDLHVARRPGATLIVLGYALRALDDHPCSVDDICQATGLMRAAATRMLRALFKHGFVHIACWDVTDGTTLRPCYRAGAGLNRRRPARQPRKVTNAKYWARRRERLRFEAVQGALAAMDRSLAEYRSERLEAA
jgi:hypothetical protein